MWLLNDVWGWVKQVWRVKQCPGSGFTQGVGLAVGAQHHPPILALSCCTAACCSATSNYPSAAHCAGSHLSPPSPSPRTFRRARGRRPGAARGLLQRPGKLLEIQTSSLRWDFSVRKMRRNSKHIVDAQNPTPTHVSWIMKQFSVWNITRTPNRDFLQNAGEAWCHVGAQPKQEIVASPDIQGKEFEKRFQFC